MGGEAICRVAESLYDRGENLRTSLARYSGRTDHLACIVSGVTLALAAADMLTEGSRLDQDACMVEYISSGDCRL